MYGMPGRIYILALMSVIQSLLVVISLLSIVGVPFGWLARLFGISMNQFDWLFFAVLFASSTISWLANQKHLAPDAMAEFPKAEKTSAQI
jgi:hypothetical protein